MDSSTDELIDSHPHFRRMAEYLASKAPPGKLPGRQHVDPAELGDLLPFIMLIDVLRDEGGAPRYRIRLMGTEVVALQGSDGTGKFVEDLLATPQGAEIVRRYGEILRTHRPQHRAGTVATHGRQHVRYERVAFPLATDGENVDMLIFVFARMDTAAG